MPRGILITLAPFICVIVLAAGVALAGYVMSPRLPAASADASSPAATMSPASLGPSTAPTSSPSATSSPAATRPAGANDAIEMLRVHNDLRAAIGAPAVRADDRVTAAAQHHAEYLARAGAIGHDEVPGDSGFSGATVRDRLAAQGYPEAMASEVAASSDSGTEDVRFLWDLPYHRLGLMHPHAVVAGWGHAEIGGHTATVGVIVFDFAATAPDRVSSPASGQRVARSWAGQESPDALTAGATRPVGYPLMVVYSGARSVDLRVAELTDVDGHDVPISVVPQIYERDYVAIVPVAPLSAGTKYRVRLALTVAGIDTLEEWEFETEP